METSEKQVENLANAKVGDTIICKNDKKLAGNEVAPPLELEKEYPLKEIYTCQCGQEHFNVGLESNYNWVTCYKCGTQIPKGDLIHWCHPSRFTIKA